MLDVEKSEADRLEFGEACMAGVRWRTNSGRVVSLEAGRCWLQQDLGMTAGAQGSGWSLSVRSSND